MDEEERSISLIEELFVGSGASDFKDFESYTDVFCPFEAIGMVRQEIRHSTFLKYIIDPHRPHGLRDLLLRELLKQIAAAAPQTCPYSLLDIHLSRPSNVITKREWRDIDLLIEIPDGITDTGKGLIIVIELKVDASESIGQLRKYRTIIQQQYPKIEWDQTFVFLTVREDEPLDKDEDIWIPLGLNDVIDGFEQAITDAEIEGPGVEYVQYYSKMMRRHVLENEKLEALAARIWAQHEEALEILYDHWPDRAGDLMIELSERSKELANLLSKNTNLSIIQDTSSANYLRFHVTDWDEYDGFCSENTSWVESGAILIIELYMTNAGDLKSAFVIGPGDTTVREELYKQFLKRVDKNKFTIARRMQTAGKKHRHLNSVILLSESELKTNEESKSKTVFDIIQKRLSTFINKSSPEYDKILRKTFE